MSLVMYTGDEKPDLVLSLSADTPVDLDDATDVRILGKRGDNILFDRTPNNTEIVGDTSVVTMLWQEGDTDTVGRIQIEVEVTWPGDKQQTFRADGGVDVRRDFDQQALIPAVPNDTEAAADAYVNAVLELQGDSWNTLLGEFVTNDDPRLTDSRPPNGGAGGVLSGTYPNPGFAVDMAEQSELDAVAASIDAAVTEAVEAHTPGIELGYAERTTSYSSAANGAITALSVTVEGQGRPVDVEFYCNSVIHTVPGTYVQARLLRDGTRIQQAGDIIPNAAAGSSFNPRQRIVLDDGISYTFTVYAFQGAAGTMTFDATSERPMWLSVVSR